MKLKSLLYGMAFAVVILAVLLLVMGVNFQPPSSVQGAALYNSANEITVAGTVQEVEEFDCPVSEGELGSHLLLKTSDGTVLVHLAPVRIMSGQQLSFASGDQLKVIGAKVRVAGKSGIIAREIVRGNEDLVFRDNAGHLLMVQ
jgi:hypothetical protein